MNRRFFLLGAATLPVAAAAAATAPSYEEKLRKVGAAVRQYATGGHTGGSRVTHAEVLAIIQRSESLLTGAQAEKIACHFVV